MNSNSVTNLSPRPVGRRYREFQPLKLRAKYVRSTVGAGSVSSSRCGANRGQSPVQWAQGTAHVALAVASLLMNTWVAPSASALNLPTSRMFSVSAPSSGDQNDTEGVIENLLSDAIAYVTELSAPPLTGSTQPPVASQEDGKALLNKLTQERDRLKKEVEKEVEKEEMEKAEKNKLKQQLQEQTKEGAATKRQVEEDLKASQAETLKKVRNEEAAKRQQEVNARKQAEAKAKEAQAARVRAEQDRKEAERARDQALHRRDTLVAAAGGAGLGVVISFTSEVFRFLGGPTIIAGLLRTPGYVVGKTFRLIEWDLHASPQEPDGAMVRVTMPLQLTRGKLRQAVANSYGLESSKGVKQFAHSFVFNAKVFYEKLEDNSAIANLPDGEVLVWTQVSPSQLQIPSRSDRLPSKTDVGISIEGSSERKTPAQEIPASKAHATIDLAHSSPSGNANGAHVVATAMQPVAQPEQPPHPPLSAAWLLSLKEPALVKQVQESIADLERISRQVESEMIAAVVDSDHVVVKLYTFSGEKDVFAFVSYVRAHLIRTGRVKS